MKKIILAFLCSSVTTLCFAQERICGTMDHLEQQKQLDPSLQSKMDSFESFTQSKILNNTSAKVSGEIFTLPVVVHVIYNSNIENISDAQIQSQIDVINDDFRRTNSDASNVWSQAADTQIEFALATIDPSGNSTTGITRKESSVTEWGTADAMKSASRGGVTPWDASEYLNMWVCNIGGGILGYAQFPGGSTATDGVVMSPQYFGSSDYGNNFYLSAPFDKGRTATHEIGHYLNLRHIWGDGNCNVDDFVNDTPTSDGANYGCDSGHTSCGTEDMVQNYMDYSDDSCMNLFTQGQKDRMHAVLETGGLRRSLALSDKFGEADESNTETPTEGNPETLSYCSSSGNSIADEWIDFVSFGGISNITGSNNGYADFTNLTGTISLNATNQLVFSAGFSSTAYTEFWSVWIDYDHDGVFSDDENVAFGSSSSDANLAVDVTTPSDATLGTTRMRVSMKYNAAQTACEIFEYGEVEDYLVNITNDASFARKVELVTDNDNTITLGNDNTLNVVTYPNPVTDFVTLQLNVKEISSFSYRIMNLMGQSVSSGTLDTTTIAVSELQSGLYILEVSGDQKTTTTKLSIQ